jgi:hypothetical protein
MDPTEEILQLVLFQKTEIHSTPNRYGFHKRGWSTKYKIKFTANIVLLSLCKQLENKCEIKNILIFNIGTREVWGVWITSWPL